jgi:hypothetical protein
MTELVPNTRYQKLGTSTKNQAGEVLVPALLVRSTNKGPGTSTNLLGFWYWYQYQLRRERS